MKKLRIKSVRTRISALMVVFTLLVAFLVSAFSYYLLYNFRKQTAIQSAEFNLQLVASFVQQDFTELTALAKWAGNDSNTSSYFLAANPRAQAIEAFDRLREEYNNSRSYKYAHRLIVTDDSYDKIMQVGSFASASSRVDRYTITALQDWDYEWDAVVEDPFSLSAQTVIPYTYPVHNTANREEIGKVYMMVSTRVITDKLVNYNLQEDGAIYITLGNNVYQIEGTALLPTQLSFTQTKDAGEYVTDYSTTAQMVKLADGQQGILVSVQVRNGISLTQFLPNSQFFDFNNLWLVMLISIVLLIIGMGFALMLSLNKHITLPLHALNRRIAAIAGGDFTPDPTIEIDGEIGEVGRGVNHLSHEVLELMDKRLADEKNKRDLEYRMLQSQMNPHFIYNTLNSIKWMATIQHADGIAEITTALSRLLKTISKDIRKIVPLADELKLLDDYFLIQRYRYGGSVTMEKRIENKELLQCSIPRFALQPLVENAIFHGIEPKGSGHILVEVKQDAIGVVVVITDNGVGVSTEQINQMLTPTPVTDAPPQNLRKLGVSSVHERIRYAFGEQYGLAIESKLGEYTTMTLHLPYQKAESQNVEGET